MAAEENSGCRGRVVKEDVISEEEVPTTPLRESVSRSRAQWVDGSEPELGELSIHSTNSLMLNLELVC